VDRARQPAEENARLREQLRAAERSLALARESLRRLPTTADLDGNEVVLLRRLLASPGDAADACSVGPDAPGGPAHLRLRRGQLAGIRTALMM
jgi:hypothetical protein